MHGISRRGLLTGAVATGAALLDPLGGRSPARAAAPAAGKQAAGWYRYKVGSIEVTAVTDGARTFPLPDTFVKNAPKDAVSASIVAGYGEKDKVTAPFTPVVVNTGGKLVVIDTGNGPAQFEATKGAVGQFLTNAKAAERNKAVKSELRTRVKTAVKSIGSDDTDEAVRLAVKRLDMAAAKGIIHPNQAARRKSRLMKRVNATG